MLEQAGQCWTELVPESEDNENISYQKIIKYSENVKSPVDQILNVSTDLVLETSGSPGRLDQVFNAGLVSF